MVFSFSSVACFQGPRQRQEEKKGLEVGQRNKSDNCWFVVFVICIILTSLVKSILAFSARILHFYQNHDLT